MTSHHVIEVSDDLWLAPIAESDRDRCVELLNDDLVSRWLLRVPHPYCDADFDKFLAIARNTTEQIGFPCHYTIHHQQHGAIGGLGFDSVVVGHKLEIGYWLGQRFQGQGIMTRVVCVACDYAIERWSVVRISANVFTGNEASARVLENNGFSREGTLRCFHRRNEQLIDSWIYARVCR